MDASRRFAGKRITVMGLGLLGRAISDIEYLAKAGAILIVTDLKSDRELAPSLARLSAYPNITYRLGGHDMADFSRGEVVPDMILKGPLVPFDSPYVARARADGIAVCMSASLFAEVAGEGVLIIGVTGTRGKTTTATLIHHILTGAKDRLETLSGSVYLGGNVRNGKGLSLIESVEPGDIVILELDSWQLRGFGEAGISPRIAVFTTFLPDHMNYYSGNMERYFADKAHIFSHQTSEDVLVVGRSAEEAIELYYRGNIASTVIAADESDVPRDWTLAIPGLHNRANAALAMRACQWLGVSENDLHRGVESFEGVEGRLQYVREVRGVSIYNDNNATTPDATIAGLQTLDDGFGNITLIVGGTDKGLDTERLVAEIRAHCSAVVLYAGTGTDRISESIKNLSGVEVVKAATLRESVRDGLDLARSRGILLYSPAFASFGAEFKNEYDRNDQFLEIVRGL